MLDVVKTFPESPGVYLMKDQKGRVLYVGKAINLRRRVRSYFLNPDRSKIKRLVEKIHDIEFIVVNNEREALLTEFNLIKKHSPPFNSKLKGKESYPFIFIDKRDKFPFFKITSKPLEHHKDLIKFGPYPFYDSAKEVCDLLNESFQLRTCSDNTLKHRNRPCILHSIGKCSAPCTKVISEENYLKQIDEAINSFKPSNLKKIIKDLETKMKSKAAEEKFEEAGRLKNAWEGWKKVAEKQSVTNLNSNDSFLYISILSENLYDHLIALEFKNGSFWGVQKKTMIHEERDLNLLSFALSLEGRVVASSYDLSPLQDLGFTIHSLNKSSKEYLEHMALENLQKSKDQELIKSSDHELLLKELQIDKLEKIECYDISHLQGTSTAGSRVVWEHGALRKNLYRHYNIRHQEGNNDFLSLSEVLRRRLEKTEDAYPDVLLIDGGKGQVEAVEAVVKDLNIQGVLVWGIAKARVKGDFKDAEVFATEERLVKNGEETPLTPGSLSYRLITTLRNEAHRFALKHHRQLRSKNQGFKK